MKKLLLVACYFIFFSLPVLADTTPDGRPIIYCPHHVECSSDDKLDSCNLSDNQYEAWGKPYNYGRVSKGRYTFKEVLSSYQSLDDFSSGNPRNGRLQCIYNLIDTHGIEKLIQISINYTMNTTKVNEFSHVYLEAFLTDQSFWNISGYDAECISENSKSCPLTETPEVGLIGNINNTKFYLDDKVIFSLGRISYNALLSLCGATTTCKINIGWINGRELKFNGSVTLDITNPDIVKIVSIDTEESSPCSLKKLEPFNAIYCDVK